MSLSDVERVVGKRLVFQIGREYVVHVDAPGRTACFSILDTDSEETLRQRLADAVNKTKNGAS